MAPLASLDLKCKKWLKKDLNNFRKSGVISTASGKRPGGFLVFPSG
jgi:hypothetical protein